MSSDGIQLTLPDGAPLYVHRWLPQGRANSAMLIVHGMGEHGGRYARFGKALNAAGVAVYAVDLPGHGRTARRTLDRGHFADRDGWNYALTAINIARLYAAAQHPRLPLYLFAHSMGSFLAQHYLVEHGRGIAGAILSSTNGSMGPMRRAGLLLVSAQAALFGLRFPSLLALDLSFRRYNQRFPDPYCDYDWLSRDRAELDRRMADPLCGFPCTAGLWIDLLHAGASLTDPERLRHLPKRIPVLLIAGTDDAVSEGGRGAELLAQAYRNAGLRDVTVWIYRGGRHELLNDTCRDEVTADMLGWLHDHMVSSKRRRLTEETVA